MLVLHGFPYSNYYNIVKHALLYKGVAFEEHIAYPGSPEIMAVNPAGKAPAMTTENGTVLAESSVLVDYLEDAYPDRSLYPRDAESRALVRQLMKMSELYVELPARRLLPEVLGSVVVDQSIKNEIKLVLDKGVRAINALAKFSPYLAGEEISMADIYLRYVLAVPKLVGVTRLNRDIFAEVEGLEQWDAMMADSDISRKVDADLRASEADFFAYIGGR